jgi:pyridinium-3,5-biscarboxylic acid mononucleotide synthase
MENEINKLIKLLLEKYSEGEIDKEIFISKIKELYFEDIGFAKIDHHRNLRRNFPEVIFGQNKSPDQIVQIAKKILNYSKILLVTRTSQDVYEILKKEIPFLEYNEKANLIFTKFPEDEANLKDGITVICAGTSDIPVAEEAAVTAYLMGNNVKRIYDVGIAGIHRLLNYKDELMKSNIIVAVAGMEGALPGVVSSLVDCLVIGVPTSVGYGASFNGLSQLLTMLNSCSPGIVVVNIDNGFGAGYAAGMMNLKIL